MLSVIRVCVLGVLLVTTGFAAEAQTYPNQPVKIVVPFAPGGPNDLVARSLGDKLAEELGQPFVLDHRPGAGGSIGAAAAAKAAPDGHTLLIFSPSVLITPNILKDLPYDMLKDLKPVSMLAKGDIGLVVSNKLGVKTLNDFIALAKSKPGQFHYGSSGNGSSLHLAGELLKDRTGINIVHVPYKGTAEMMTALLAGNIGVGFTSLPPALGLIQSGQLTILGVASDRRASTLPNVPTLIEQGLKDFEITSYYGLLSPSKVSDQIIQTLNAKLQKALSSEDIKKRFAAANLETFWKSPQDSNAFIRTEVERWSTAAKAAGLKPQ